MGHEYCVETGDPSVQARPQPLQLQNRLRIDPGSTPNIAPWGSVVVGVLVPHWWLRGRSSVVPSLFRGGSLLAPWFSRGGSVVEPWWIRGGSVVVM